jgi:hypothetical protein
MSETQLDAFCTGGSSRPVWSKKSSGPLPHARTSLQAQVNDKSGSVDPFLGPDRTHPYICEIATHDTLSLPLRLRRHVEFVGDELSVPGQQRIRLRDRRQFFQGFPSEPLGDLRQCRLFTF